MEVKLEQLRKLRKLIENSTISDEDVYYAIREAVADKFDESGNIIPPTIEEQEEIESLGILTEKLRPQVQERLGSDFLREHGEHCPACQELKIKAENKKP